jgi:hypothetical protein
MSAARAAKPDSLWKVRGEEEGGGRRVPEDPAHDFDGEDGPFVVDTLHPERSSYEVAQGYEGEYRLFF